MDIKRVKRFYGLGDFDRVPVEVETDSGPSDSTMTGQVLFEGTRQEKGVVLRVAAFKATVAGVKCEAGDSGLISLSAVKKASRWSIGDAGDLVGSAKLNVHCPLIDRLMGYRQSREKEQDNFAPFVATARGTFKGRFAKGTNAVIREYKSIDHPPSTTLDLSGILAADEYYIHKLVFDFQVKILFPLALMRSLNIQPVFVRANAADPAPTGWSFDTLVENARVMWRKCCIHLAVRPPIYVDDAAFKSISTVQEVASLRTKVADAADAIEMFVTSSLGSLESPWGGGASFGSGTAAAQVVTCDSQLRVYDGTTSRGAINYNHYAHELGHVLSLAHPGTAASAPMVAATANTVMEPSGFFADNPHTQSHFNCDNADNPILRWMIVTWDRRCVHNPEV